MEDHIMPYVKCESDGDLLGDEKICGLCMQSFSSTKESGVCSVCARSLDTPTNFFNNVMNVKEEINDICDGRAIEGLYSIKFEEIDIKSEENFDPSHNMKEEPADCNSECQSEYVKTTNNSSPNHKGKQGGSRDNYRNLQHGDFFEEQTDKCISCDCKTDQKRNLRLHRQCQKDVPEEHMYHCDLCNFKTKRNYNLTQHQLVHKDLPEDHMYQCDSCDYKTKRKNNLKQHQHIHKDIPADQMYKCDSCDYKSSQKFLLTRHQQRHKDVPEDQMYRCGMCDYKTGHKEYLTQHQKRKHPQKADIYKCDLCVYKTSQKRNLTQHKRRHKDVSEDQMYKCDSCDYKTGHREYFTQHQRRKHRQKADAMEKNHQGYSLKGSTNTEACSQTDIQMWLVLW